MYPMDMWGGSACTAVPILSYYDAIVLIAEGMIPVISSEQIR